MSKLKDKLSANMRVVKANPKSPAATPAKAVTKPIAKSAAAKPAATKKPAPRAPAAAQDSMGEVPNSGSSLFPSRVWPD